MEPQNSPAVIPITSASLDANIGYLGKLQQSALRAGI